MNNILINMLWINLGQRLLVAILEPNFITSVRVPVVKNHFCLFIGQKRVDIQQISKILFVHKYWPIVDIFSKNCVTIDQVVVFPPVLNTDRHYLKSLF